MRDLSMAARRLLNVIVLSGGQTDDLTTSEAALGYIANLDHDAMAEAVAALVEAGLLTVEPRPTPVRKRPRGYPIEFWTSPHACYRPTHVRHVIGSGGLLAVPDLDHVEGLTGAALDHAGAVFVIVADTSFGIGARPRRKQIPAVDLEHIYAIGPVRAAARKFHLSRFNAGRIARGLSPIRGRDE